jgi:hypothetical protein
MILRAGWPIAFRSLLKGNQRNAGAQRLRRDDENASARKQFFRQNVDNLLRLGDNHS